MIVFYIYANMRNGMKYKKGGYQILILKQFFIQLMKISIEIQSQRPHILFEKN